VRPCNCIVQGMSGRGAPRRPVGTWGPLGRHERRVAARARDRQWPPRVRGGGELTAAAARSSDPRWEEVEQHRAAALRLLGRTFSGLQGQHDDIWQEVATALFTRSKEQGFWPDNLRNYLLGAVAKKRRQQAADGKNSEHPRQ
jgi:hypothetical protein